MTSLAVEEKYGTVKSTATKNSHTACEVLIPKVNGFSPSLSSSSSSEEDDEGLLVTETLDAEIVAALEAIKSKDPRVYDKGARFYSAIEDDESQGGQKREKPMYLRDYHREMLLHGDSGEEEVVGGIGLSYVQQQDGLRRGVVEKLRFPTNADSSRSGSHDNDRSDEDENFFAIKEKSVLDSSNVSLGKTSAEVDETVPKAEKQPEQFLTDYLSSRAWVPTPSSCFVPFESDDEEEDQRAEEFEQAFNFRFEDPQASNEKLMFHSREAATRYSVRRDEPTGRRKAREVERERREARKKEEKEERARLRRLKIEEAEEKLKKIKETAGLRGATVKEVDWRGFLENDWDTNTWEEAMNEWFGEAYYAEDETGSHGPGGETGRRAGDKPPRKPKWDDDIDITDLVPSFNDDNQDVKSKLVLSEDESGNSRPSVRQYPENGDMDDFDAVENRSRLKKARTQRLVEQKKVARKERKLIETIVDEKLDLTGLPQHGSSLPQGRFRYRDTSPTTYGLTSRDILMASDSQLNQFVGLKKLASFRATDKKQKDKKKFGKKARLRQWRKETFGSQDVPNLTLNTEPSASDVMTNRTQEDEGARKGDVREGRRKRKRPKRGTQGAIEV